MGRIRVLREGMGVLFGEVGERRRVRLDHTLVLVLDQALRVLAGSWDLLQAQKDQATSNVQSRSTGDVRNAHFCSDIFVESGWIQFFLRGILTKT